MKAVIIYSGKGGVGKTTTTSNLARLLARQGHRVFIIDADINTPSINTEFEGDHPHENIWVHSSGNMFSGFIYLEKSMIRQYLSVAKKKLHTVNPDYVLIDTPPSITNTHIELLSSLHVGYVLFVTQPTKLSISDVTRTMQFFCERCGNVPCGIVENMCYSFEEREYPIKIVAQIPMQDKMDTSSLLDNAEGEFQKIITEINNSSNTLIEELPISDTYDETFEVTQIRVTEKRLHSYYECTLQYDNGEVKILMLPQLKFLNVRSWRYIWNYICDNYDYNRCDQRILCCDEQRIRRLVDNFRGDINAYFMVTKAPHTTPHLIAGEIGVCTLHTDGKYHFGIPTVTYQTSRGDVTLFPDEVLPVSTEEIQHNLSEGYVPLGDGRYLPPKETVQMCFNAFGARVGLYPNWEETYYMWVNKK